MGVDDTGIGECVELYKPARMGYGPPCCQEEDDEGGCLRGNQHAVCSEG